MSLDRGSRGGAPCPGPSCPPIKRPCCQISQCGRAGSIAYFLWSLQTTRPQHRTSSSPQRSILGSRFDDYGRFHRHHRLYRRHVGRFTWRCTSNGPTRKISIPYMLIHAIAVQHRFQIIWVCGADTVQGLRSCAPYRKSGLDSHHRALSRQ